MKIECHLAFANAYSMDSKNKMDAILCGPCSYCGSDSVPKLPQKQSKSI